MLTVHCHYRGVTQSCTLLYRRFLICDLLKPTLHNLQQSPMFEALTDTMSTFGRMQFCDTA
jgi:hypothetical protein